MRCGPAVGQHFLQTLVIRVEAEQKVANVRPWFKSMTFRAGQNRVQHRCPRSGILAPQEQPILAPYRDGPQGALEMVGVNGNVWIGEEDFKPLLALECVEGGLR